MTTGRDAEGAADRLGLRVGRPAGYSEAMTLLGPSDPAPVRISRPGGRSPFLLVADHAGDRIPFSLGDLGIAAADRSRHVALDLGIAPLGALLADLLDATLIACRYSRLVIDCNRPPGHPGSIPPASDGTIVPANRGLDAAARRTREREILEPYQAAIDRALVERATAGRVAVLVSLHSFTPRLLEAGDVPPRPWHAGVLHDGSSVFSHAVLAALRRRPRLVIGDNEPYRLTTLSDYTVPLHAGRHRCEHVELEVRQDELADTAGQRRWAGRLASVLDDALGAIRHDPTRAA